MTPRDKKTTLLSRRAMLFGGGALLVTARAAVAQTLAGDDLRAVLDRRALRVAAPNFASPPFFAKAGETDRGVDVEIARSLAEALEVDLAFDRSAATFDEAVEAAAEGRADLVIGKLSRTIRRGRLIRYSRPYAELHHGLIVNRLRFARMAAGAPAEDVIRGFKGDLGVIAHSSFAEFARENFPAARVHEYGDWPALVEAVRAERIDMAYRDDFEIKKLLVDDPSLTVVARSITLTDKTDTIAIGIRPDAPHLASFADLFLDLSRNGAVLSSDALIARYRTGT
jgi:ABC-type amino acid transport substrate-binding protein